MSKKNEVVYLHDLKNEFLDLMEIFDDVGGELTEELEEKYKKVQEAIAKETDDIANWIDFQDSVISLAKERTARLQKLIKQVELRVSNFENYMGGCIKQMNTDRIEGLTRTIKLRAPSDVVYIENENDLPFEYLVTPEPQKAKPDLNLIKDAIKKGELVPGATIVKSKKITFLYGYKK